MVGLLLIAGLLAGPALGLPGGPADLSARTPGGAATPDLSAAEPDASAAQGDPSASPGEDDEPASPPPPSPPPSAAPASPKDGPVTKSASPEGAETQSGDPDSSASAPAGAPAQASAQEVSGASIPGWNEINVNIGQPTTLVAPFSAGTGNGHDSGRSALGNSGNWRWSWDRINGILKVESDAIGGSTALTPVDTYATASLVDNRRFQKRCNEQVSSRQATATLQYFYNGGSIAVVTKANGIISAAGGESALTGFVSGDGSSEVLDVSQYANAAWRSSSYGTETRWASQGFTATAGGLASPAVRFEAHTDGSAGWTVQQNGFPILDSFSGTSDAFTGSYTVNLQSISLNWPSDGSPPSSSASLSGAQGPGGWFRSAVNVNVHSEDAESCVQFIQFSIDGGSWQTVAVNPFNPNVSFTVDGEGFHTVFYRAWNFDGAAEGVRSVSVDIDKTPPSASLDRPRGGFCYVQDIEVPTLGLATCATGTSVTVRGSAFDGLSGVWNLQFYVDGNWIGSSGGSSGSANWGIATTVLSHTPSVCAQDRAGNVGCRSGPSVLVLG